MNRIVINGSEIIVGNGEKLISFFSFWTAFWMGVVCGFLLFFFIAYLLHDGEEEKRNRQIEEIHKRLCGDHPEGSKDNATHP